VAAAGPHSVLAACFFNFDYIRLELQLRTEVGHEMTDLPKQAVVNQDNQFPMITILHATVGT
jgi:hypothetical protein